MARMAKAQSFQSDSSAKKRPLPERHSEDRHKGSGVFMRYMVPFSAVCKTPRHRSEELESRLDFEKGKKKQEAHTHTQHLLEEVRGSVKLGTVRSGGVTSYARRKT